MTDLPKGAFAMFAFHIAMQRKRKLLLKGAALVLLGALAIGLALPRADANVRTTRAVPSDLTALLSPQPVSSAEFGAFYAPHRG
jgi:hypothetical protein